jgi:hypothetical protein
VQDVVDNDLGPLADAVESLIDRINRDDASS